MMLSDKLESALWGWHRREREGEQGLWEAVTLTKGSKSRLLHVPCDSLKRTHRLLNHTVLAGFDQQRGSYCRKGFGVLAAVAAHESHPALLHRDLAAFFPSVKRQRIVRVLTDLGLSSKHARLVGAVCTHAGVLPQGAPTSVTLGNLVLAKLDERLETLCRRHGLTYTRYVDDLAISGGPARLEQLTPHIDRIIRHEGWTIGDTKGGFYTPGEYREYLGVSVGSRLAPGAIARGKIERAYEQFENGSIDHLRLLQLTGWRRDLARTSHRRASHKLA